MHEDGVVLLNTLKADLLKVLYYFPWKTYRKFCAKYYDALYEFNKREEEKRPEDIRIAGIELKRNGFRICKFCGKV